MSPEIVFDPYVSLYSEATSLMKSSEVRDLMSITGRSDMISFAGGLPYIEGIPHEDITSSMGAVLEENYCSALQYGETEGRPSLREALVEVMAEEGVACESDHIQITTGSQQALDLLARVFVNRGDTIVIEGPSYLGALSAFRPVNPEFVTVPLDENGMRVELLEELLRTGRIRRPKFIYVVPNFHNPGGVTMSLERRVRLLELAEEFDLLVIEDNPYGLLRYEGEALPTLVSMDCKRVIYVGTLSKIISPGIRTGWIMAPSPVVERVATLKQGADLCSSSLSQMFAEQYIRKGYWKKNLGASLPTYRARRDAMLSSLEEHFPQGATWTTPQGGLFLWVTLPGFVDSRKVLPLAILQRVAFVPGTAFYADGAGARHMRLNYSFVSEDRIEEGIKRLGKVLKREIRLCEALGLAE